MYIPALWFTSPLFSALFGEVVQPLYNGMQDAKKRLSQIIRYYFEYFLHKFLEKYFFRVYCLAN